MQVNLGRRVGAVVNHFDRALVLHDDAFALALVLLLAVQLHS